MNQIKKVGAVTLLGLLPLVTQAQQHIKAAFDALVQDNSVELSVEHKLEKDPDTGEKESQFDFWEFTLPKSKQLLVNNIRRAFDQDSEQAYSISTGSNSRGGEGVEVLAVGNGNFGGYSVGEIKGSDYIYALFLDPDDAERIHRYAYVLEWKDNGEEILGRLVVTYATTQKYRRGDSTTRRRQRIILNGSSFDGIGFDALGSFQVTDGSNWLAHFNLYAKMFRQSPKSTASSYYANYIYELCKHSEASQLSVDEKKMVVEELAKLKQMTDDEFTQNIFMKAMKNIK